MSDNRPPYHRRSTKPFPRVELPPIARSTPADEPDQDQIETQVTCPCCLGARMIPATRAAEWAKKYPEATIFERQEPKDIGE